MKIRKAIIPAAGLGTRFLPATKAMPKEMLPIVDKPTIQYIIEEAVQSGIEDIIIVTGKGKRAIEDHFDHSFELENALFEKGKFDVLEQVRSSSNLVDKKSLKVSGMQSGVQENLSETNHLLYCLAMTSWKQIPLVCDK